MLYKFSARFDEAEALYDRALKLIEEVLGYDNRDVASI